MTPKRKCRSGRGWVSSLLAMALLSGSVGLSAALLAQNSGNRPSAADEPRGAFEGTPKPERPRVNRRGPPPRLPDAQELALMERFIDLEPEKLRRLIEFLERVEEMSPEEKEKLKQRIEDMRTTFKRISDEDREWLKFLTLSLTPDEREAHFEALRQLQPEERAQYLQGQLDAVRATGITIEQLEARARENVKEYGLPKPVRRERLERLREEGAGLSEEERREMRERLRDGGNLTEEERRELRERLRERRNKPRPSGLEPPPTEETVETSTSGETE